MPFDSPSGWKPWQQQIIDNASDTETVVLFGGNIGEFSRKHVKELQEIASDPAHRQSDRKAALEKLQRWADQGSKFAQAALKDMGLGSHAMSDREFESALNNMQLDPKTKAKVRSFGKNFFRFTSTLANPQTAEDTLNLRDLAQRSGRDEAAEFIGIANDSAIESINIAFTEANPSYFRSDANFQTLVRFLSDLYLHKDYGDCEELMQELYSRGFLSVETLTDAFRILSAEGLMEVRPGQAKPLTADDKQALSIAAAAIATDRDLDRVLNAYLRFSLGDDAPQSWRQVIGQSQYASVLFQAVIFCWSHKRADYIPSEGAEEYLRKYLAGRFPTFPLLDAAWERCKKQTDGRGYVSEMESMVSDAQTHQDDELERINRKYSVG